MPQLVKNPLAMWETWVQCLGWEDSPGKGKGYPLQYSSLENSMDCIVHGVTKSWAQLRDSHFWPRPQGRQRTVSGERDLGSGQLAGSVALVAPLPSWDRFPSQSHTPLPPSHSQLHQSLILRKPLGQDISPSNYWGKSSSAEEKTRLRPRADSEPGGGAPSSPMGIQRLQDMGCPRAKCSFNIITLNTNKIVF